MGALGLLSLGFAPGLLWLWLIVRRSRHRPEPRSLIIRTFLLGVAVAVPIVLVEALVGGQGGSSASRAAPMTPEAAAFAAFALAGLCEEIGKLWVVHASLRRSPYLDDPLRGLIFSSAVALGFSSIENVEYMVMYGAEVIVVRAVLCTLGHVMFSSFWGFALGWAHLHPGRGRVALVVGVTAAIAAHGLYDYFLMVGDSGSSLFVFAAGSVLFLLLLSRSRSASQAAHATLAILSCRSCGVAAPTNAAFCPGCGSRFGAEAARHCGRCKAALPKTAVFCPNCGGSVAAS